MSAPNTGGETCRGGHEGAPAGACILVVDDNPTNLKLATALLELEGHQVMRATDAEQAQALLQARLPDLILMDIALPGMDGLELTRRLKADARYARLPILALTASAMKGDEAKARDAGCDGYITKPIDTRTLPGRIAQALAARGGR
jgi:CheY-like chemotaxis protein